MNEVKMEIFNRTYIVRGDKPVTHLRRVAREVDYRMKEVSEMAPNMDVTRTAVLTALNLAEEYLELQERYDRVVKMLEEEYEKNREHDDPVIPIRRGEGDEVRGEGR
ncbi:MAG: cell division protein ZapA [Bacillota bacterium]